MMKNSISIKKPTLWLPVLVACLFFSSAQAQQDRQDKNQKKVQRETDKLLQNAEINLGENDFSSAEANFRKAVSKNPEEVKAPYNMANMYYGKEKPSEAENRYKQAAKVAETKDGKHKVFHNLGNSFMEQKKYKEAVEAYKNALRSDPTDDQTRYNLALAQKMLEKNKNKGGGNDDKNKDQNKDKKNKDQDKNKGDKDKKDGDKKEDQGGDKKDDSKKQPEKPDDKGDKKDQKKPQDENGDKKKDEQPPKQPQQSQGKGQLSPQQIKSLLEAMNNEEKKVQDKINAQKAKGRKTPNEKDW